MLSSGPAVVKRSLEAPKTRRSMEMLHFGPGRDQGAPRLGGRYQPRQAKMRRMT